jgi:hypothetical protein
MSALDSWTRGSHTYDGTTHPTWRKGTGPGVVVVHEIPGITDAVVAAEGCAVLGLRFRKDPATGTRFDTLRRELGEGFVAVEFEGRGHSTVTEHRRQEAADRVLAFFRERLQTQNVS